MIKKKVEYMCELFSTNVLFQTLEPWFGALTIFTWAQWFLKTIMQVSGSTPFKSTDCPSRFPLATMEAISVTGSCVS